MSSHPSDRARFGPFEVDLHTHELWKFGTRLKLVGQPFEILAVLLQRSGELVTRDELRNRLWPSDTFVDFNHGLNAAVNKLRDTLSDSADSPRYVETLPRRGYRFIARVEWLDSRNLSSPQPLPPPVDVPQTDRSQPEFSLIQDPALHASPVRNLWLRYFMGAGVIFTILLICGLALHVVPGFTGASSARAMVEHTRPLLSIANTLNPAFSADGNRVAFYREHSQPGESGIYAGQVGSDRPLQLTRDEQDCCPVWSPDGRFILFARRINDNSYSLHLIAADGGSEQKRQAERALGAQTQSPVEKLAAATAYNTVDGDHDVPTGGVTPTRGAVDWSPDGKQIAFSGSAGIYLLSLANFAVRSVTQSPPMSSDWGPSFSPDGKDILFVRTQQIGAPDEIWSVPTNGGDPTHLFSERGKIGSPPQWSFDGRSIIFASNRTGHPALWRVSLDSPGEAMQVSEAGSPAWDPAVSRRGYRLAYERLLKSLSIWEIDLSGNDKRPFLVVSSTSNTDQGPGPQISPDGQKLAFMSDRSGTMEIWIANRDGSNPFELTAVGSAGTPRWSPDSQTIVFDMRAIGGEKIVTMNLHGGAPQPLTEGICPSYSHDGKWIYFVSARSGAWQVWKIPSDGGAAIQVTQHGGHAALESLDGKFVYYAKSPDPEPEIWRVPVNSSDLNGTDEAPVPLVHPGTWASWQMTSNGILFVGPSLGHQAALSFYDFAHDRTDTIAVLNRIPFWLGATRDGKSVIFDQPGQEQAQAMLVENFR